MREIEEVRDTFGRGAEPLQPLVRPGRGGGARELRQHAFVEEEPHVQLLAVLAQEQRLVRARPRRVPFAERAVDEEIAYRRCLDAMDRLQELLELREPEQGAHCTKPFRGITPWRTSSVARRSLPVFIQRS